MNKEDGRELHDFGVPALSRTELGDRLKGRFAGWRVYVITGDARVPKLIGFAPSKRIPLFNGDLECRLYEFVIVQGGARRRLTPETQV